MHRERTHQSCIPFFFHSGRNHELLLIIGTNHPGTEYTQLEVSIFLVAFAIRDSFEVAKGLGLSVPRSNICGGGSRSMLWKRILANVLGIPLDVVKTSEGPGYGAALLAMVACGEYETVAQACSALVRTVDTVEPDASLTALYEERYRQFRQIYPVCRALFPKLL